MHRKLKTLKKLSGTLTIISNENPSDLIRQIKVQTLSNDISSLQGQGIRKLYTKKFLVIAILSLALISEGLVSCRKVTDSYNRSGHSVSGQELFPVQSKGLFGYTDRSGRIVIDYRFDEADEFSEGLAAVSLRKQYGFIDSAGEMLVDYMYDKVGYFINGTAIVVSDGRYGLINRNGKTITGLIYDDLQSMGDGYYIAKQNDRVFLLHGNGRHVMDITYPHVILWCENKLLVADERKEFMYIDTNGTILIRDGYEYIDPFIHQRAVVRKKRLFGYIDLTGKQVIPCMFEDAAPFSEGRAAVKKNNKWGYIDTNGRTVIPMQYNMAGIFHNGLAEIGIRQSTVAVKNSMAEKYFALSGFIDTAGRPVTPVIFLGVSRFENGISIVSTRNNEGKIVSGWIDKQGTLITDWFDEIEPKDKTGLFSVTRSGSNPDQIVQEALFDSSGGRISEWYDKIYPFQEGYAVVIKDGLSGFVDMNGRLVIPCQYEEANSFYCGRAFVRKNGLFGSIDDGGNIIINFQYDFAYPYFQGVTVVKKDNRLGMIDSKGRALIPAKYDTIYPPEKGYVRVKKNGLNSYFNVAGKQITDWYPYHYSIQNLDQKLFIENNDDGYALLSHTGKRSARYDNLTYFDYSLFRGIKNKQQYILSMKTLEELGCYEDIHNFLYGFAVIKKQGKFGYIDKNGNLAVEPKYDEAADFETTARLFPIKRPSLFEYTGLSLKLFYATLQYALLTRRNRSETSVAEKKIIYSAQVIQNGEKAIIVKEGNRIYDGNGNDITCSNNQKGHLLAFFFVILPLVILLALHKMFRVLIERNYYK